MLGVTVGSGVLVYVGTGVLVFVGVGVAVGTKQLIDVLADPDAPVLSYKITYHGPSAKPDHE